MAIIKSILLGTARKSISDVNFYKTKGVQIARSKPSIAPSYKPTTAQELQRYKMGFAQYVVNNADWKSFSWLLNRTNVRKKNAASPTNRMVSNLLRADATFVSDTNASYYDLLVSKGEYLIDSVSSGGDVFPDTALDISTSSTIGYNKKGLGIIDYAGTIKSMLDTLKLTYQNMVVFGWTQTYFEKDETQTQFPGTVYPCKIEVALTRSSYVEYFCRPIIGRVGETGIIGYPSIDDIYIEFTSLYLAIVNNPIGDNVITGGTVITYSRSSFPI